MSCGARDGNMRNNGAVVADSDLLADAQSRAIFGFV